MIFYKNEYINEYQEKDYLEVLNNPSKLNKLKNAFLNKYKDDEKIDVVDILFKESLEHYLLKKITNDPSFINTTRMYNYMVCFADIYNKNKMEFNTNVLFKDKETRTKLLNKFFPKYRDTFEKKYNEYNDKCDLIIEKIKNKKNIDLSELDFAAEYLAKLRAPALEEYKILMNYIFSNIENEKIKFTYPVKDFILSYLPHFYSEGGVKHVRMVLGDQDKNYNIKGPGHSSGTGKYVALNKSIFKDIKHSIKNSYYERLKQGDDFTFFMIVCFHELAHQLQKENIESGLFDDKTMGYIFNLVMNQYLNDYSDNHDSCEMEIDANYKAWGKCLSFYNEFYFATNKDKLKSNCIDNKNTSDLRRIISEKISNTEIFKSVALYDIGHLVEIIGKHPEIVRKFPMLKHFFTETGKISTKYIYNMSLYAYSTGVEFTNYFIEKGGIPQVIEEMDTKRLSYNQLLNMINNLFYHIKSNFRKIEQLDRQSKRTNMGEYKLNKIKDGSDYKKLELTYYKQSLDYYKAITPLFNKIYSMYADQRKFINWCKGNLDKDIIKYSYITQGENTSIKYK